MHCKNCGNKINEKSKFCGKCGFDLVESKELLKEGEQEAIVEIDIEKVEKSLNKSGNSLSAIGWLTIIASIGIYFWSISDVNFSNYGILTPELSGTWVTIFMSIIFIILGNRIKEGVDSKIGVYLRISLSLAILIAIWTLSSGGKIGIIFILVVFYLISSLSLFKKAYKNINYKKTLISPVYFLNKKKWWLFIIFSIIIFFLTIFWDLKSTEVQGNIKIEQTLENKSLEKIKDNELDVILKNASREVNKTLPLMVDKTTQLESTFIFKKDLNYNYKIIDSTSNLNQKALDLYLKDRLTNNVCTNPDTKSLLDYGAGMVYNYYDNEGLFIGKISINGDNCL